MAYLAQFVPPIPTDKLTALLNGVTDPGARILIEDFTEILPQDMGIRLNVGTEGMMGSIKSLLENVIIGTPYSDRTLSVETISK
jgi:hypothetical protein